MLTIIINGAILLLVFAVIYTIGVALMVFGMNQIERDDKNGNR